MSRRFLFAIVDTIDKRANRASAVRVRDDTAIDPYVFTREAYRQRRAFLVHDANPPLADFGEDLDDEEDAERILATQ